MWMGENRQVIIVTSPAADSPSSRKIGVFLLYDHEIVRRGVRELLEAEPDIRGCDPASRVNQG
jgi:two-component system response regulator DevR